MFCPRCSYANRDDSNYCRNCGSQINQEKVVVLQPQESYTDQVVHKVVDVATLWILARYTSLAWFWLNVIVAVLCADEQGAHFTYLAAFMITFFLWVVSSLFVVYDNRLFRTWAIICWTVYPAAIGVVWLFWQLGASANTTTGLPSCSALTNKLMSENYFTQSQAEEYIYFNPDKCKKD